MVDLLPIYSGLKVYNKEIYIKISREDESVAYEAGELGGKHPLD